MYHSLLIILNRSDPCNRFNLLQMWDIANQKKIGETECSDTTHVKWAPCGQYLMTATCSPRLRVNNGQVSINSHSRTNALSPFLYKQSEIVSKHQFYFCREKADVLMIFSDTRYGTIQEHCSMRHLQMNSMLLVFYPIPSQLSLSLCRANLSKALNPPQLQVRQILSLHCME